MNYPPELIEAVRTVNPVEKVVGEYVQLRRSGAQLVGRCPFHADRSPSFYVHPGKGRFFCHGCQAGGDVFSFVQKQTHCGFNDAVKLLAERAGVRVGSFRPSPELRAKVAAAKAHREELEAFSHWRDARIEEVNSHYRNLGRAATHAENYLRSGETDPYLHELAWDALERFRTFEARIEREGLLDVGLLRAEWELQRGGHVAA